jgi:hypothetical protein
MSSPSKDSIKIPTIWLDSTSKSAYSIFNANSWTDNSKAIIMSCAAQYSLLEYQATKISSLVQYSRKICELRFKELYDQWKKSPWDISKGDYLVEIPEFHLNIVAYLATIKVLLDLTAQLISTEGIVDKTIHGFHKKGTQVGGELLQILSTKAKSEKADTASKLFKLIVDQKRIWIDQAVNVRDILVHPEKGLLQVMFRMKVGIIKGNLKLIQILQPTLAGQEFDQYAQMTFMQMENFSKTYLGIIKIA